MGQSGRQFPHYLFGVIFLIGLLLAACGKTSGEGMDGDLASDVQSGGGSADANYDEQADEAADLLDEGMNTLAESDPSDQDLQQAAQATGPAVQSMKSLYGLLRKLGLEGGSSYSQVQSAQNTLVTRLTQVANILRNHARYRKLAVMFAQLAAQRPVMLVQERVNANIVKNWYVHPDQVTAVQNTIRAARRVGPRIALMVWNSAAPIPQHFTDLVPQIATKPLHACALRTRGNVVSNNANCTEVAARLLLPAAASVPFRRHQLGYTSTSPRIPELMIHLLRRKTIDRTRYILTVKADARVNQTGTFAIVNGNLGGVAVPEFPRF